MRTRLSKSNRRNKCIDYKERYSVCNSRFHCIDKCVHGDFFAKFGNITHLSDSPIDKDFFSEEEWNQSFLVTKNVGSEIRKKCMEKFPDIQSCENVRFDNNAEIKTAEDGLIQLDLYYDSVWTVEEEPSYYKLVLDILNIQIFFYGNPLKLFHTVVVFIRAKLKIRGSRIYLLVTYLVCLVGLALHTAHIFVHIINGELRHHQYSEMRDRLKMPNIILCFEINRTTIEQEPKLTGNRLEELTSDLEAEKIIEEIHYLNGSYEWTKLSSSFAMNATEPLEIENFYFMAMKCIVVKLRMEYELNRLLLKDRRVFKMNFRKSFINAQDPAKFYLLTRMVDTMEFSKISKLSFNFYDDYKYFLEQELLEFR